MKEIYEKYELHAKMPTKAMLEKTSHTYRIIYGKFIPNKNVKILDVGCGAGYFLYFLKKEGYKNFLGIDLSKKEIEFCKRNISKKVVFANVFNFLNKNRNYDLIVMNHLLEHIEKKRVINILRLCYNALNKNGKLFIQVPNTSNPFSLHSRYIDITHEIGFTDSSLREVLKISGFKNINLFGALPFGSKKSKIRNIITKTIYPFIKFLFILQGYGAPKFLEPKLIAIAIK